MDMNLSRAATSWLLIDCDRRPEFKCTCGSCLKKPLMRCGCNEKVLYLNRGEVILKSKILKVSEGASLAKCKRCGRWLEVPLLLSGKIGRG